MPRHGSTILSDLCSAVLRIECPACGRSGRYGVERVIAEVGDVRLTTW